MDDLPTFDPSVKYRNMLIAMSRNIKKFERKAKEMDDLGKKWASSKAKDYLYAAKTMRYTMSRQVDALKYYFATEDTEIISQVTMLGDNMGREFEDGH